MLKDIVEKVAVEEADNTTKIKKNLDKVQSLLVDCMKLAQGEQKDLPFDDINDMVGDINGNL